MTIERAIYEFLLDIVAAAPSGSPLIDAEVGDSEFAEIQKDFGFQVGPKDGETSPTPGATAMEIFNADVVLICYSALAGERDERADDRDKVEALALAAALQFTLDPTCGGRVNDCLAKRLTMGFGDIDGTAYAIANLILRVNDMGQNGGAE